MIADPHETITFSEVINDPDNESGILSQVFALSKHEDGAVYFAAAMYPTDDVMDASESDFPDAEFMLSVEQFKSLTKMFLRFDEVYT